MHNMVCEMKAAREAAGIRAAPAQMQVTPQARSQRKAKPSNGFDFPVKNEAPPEADNMQRLLSLLASSHSAAIAGSYCHAPSDGCKPDETAAPEKLQNFASSAFKNGPSETKVPFPSRWGEPPVPDAPANPDADKPPVVQQEVDSYKQEKGASNKITAASNKIKDVSQYKGAMPPKKEAAPQEQADAPASGNSEKRPPMAISDIVRPRGAGSTPSHEETRDTYARSSQPAVAIVARAGKGSAQTTISNSVRSTAPKGTPAAKKLPGGIKLPPNVAKLLPKNSHMCTV